MDLSTVSSSLQSALATHLPGILAALGILIVGWLVAVAVRIGVRRLLGFVRLNSRIGEQTERKVDVESSVAKVAFWLIILVTLIGVFNTLDLPLLAGPFEKLVEQVAAYLPRLLAGTMLLVIAWLAASVLRGLVNKTLDVSGIDERLSAEAGMAPMRGSVGNMIFWLVILLFLPAILGAYQLTGLLDPVKAMVDEVLGALPNVFAAFVIGFAGWLIAKVLSGLVTNVLAAAGADRAGGRLGLQESVRLSRIAGTLVLIFVFVPALIAALEALKIDAISGPATAMLATLLAAVPDIVAAVLILTITYYVARFATGLLAQLLVSLEADALPEKLGVAHLFTGRMQPSRLAPGVVLFFAMLFATVEAANRLGFDQVRDVVTLFIQFGGNVLIGATILVVGFWLANLASQVITRAAGGNQRGLARIAQLAILGLVIAMGLRAMGIADDIVNLAFALTLGSVAVATALSFGLGGRDAAGRQMEYWLSRLRKQE